MIQIHGGNFNLEKIWTKLGSCAVTYYKIRSNAYKFIDRKNSYLVENSWFPALIFLVADNTRDRVLNNKRTIRTQHLSFTAFCRISSNSKFLLLLSIVTSDTVTGCNCRNIPLRTQQLHWLVKLKACNETPAGIAEFTDFFLKHV